VSAIIKTDIASSTTQVVSGAITGDMKLNYNDMLRSTALAGALSVVTTTIDTKMGYNKIDPSTGKQVVLSYGDKISREMLHGLATKAVYGGDIETIMASSAGNVAFDYIAHDVYAKNPDFPVPKTLTHALIGGALSELAGGDFSQGAISTAVAHVVADTLVSSYAIDVAIGDKTFDEAQKQLEAISKAVAGSVTLATHENVSDKELELALTMASSVSLNNDAKEMQKRVNSLTPEENLALKAYKSMTPEEKEQLAIFLGDSDAGMEDASAILIPFGKPIEGLLGGIASKLGVSTTVLLEKLGVVSPKIVVNTLDDAKNIVSSTATQAGRAGKDFKVASEKELNALYQSLTKNTVRTDTKLSDGVKITTNYLKDGSKIVYRTDSKTGGAAIDLQSAAGNIKQKVHIGQ
jgi:formaldehyde-activating enzyme involved in methanogenesis